MATLVPIGCPIFAPNGTSGPRWFHVSIPWTRSKALQVGNIYGYDVGQPDAVKCNRVLHHEILQVLFLLGRTPWIIGGDWNLAPDQVALPLFAGGAAIDPGLPTVDTGSTLDWFLAGPCMRDLAISRVLTAAPIAVDRPVTLGLQAVQQMDLGKCVVVPTPLTQVVTGPHPQLCGWEFNGDQDEIWSQWTGQAERWLSTLHGKEQPTIGGRGSPLAFRTRTLGAPHARGDGVALNGRAAALQRQLNRARALRGLLRKPDNPSTREQKQKLQCGVLVPPQLLHAWISSKERELNLLKRGLRQHREAAWKKVGS